MHLGRVLSKIPLISLSFLWLSTTLQGQLDPWLLPIILSTCYSLTTKLLVLQEEPSMQLLDDTEEENSDENSKLAMDTSTSPGK